MVGHVRKQLWIKIAGLVLMVTAGAGFFPVYALLAGEGNVTHDPWWYRLVGLGWFAAAAAGVALWIRAEGQDRP